jgi:hypothetical protein
LLNSIERNSNLLVILYGFLLGVGLQLHLSILAFIVTSLIYLWFYAPRKISIFWLFPGLVLGYAPIIIYDLFHNFSNLLGLIFISSLHAVDEPRLFHFAKTFWNFSNVLSGQALWVSKLAEKPYQPAWVEWGEGILITGLFLAAFVSLLVNSARGKRGMRALAFNHRDGLLLLFITIPAVYLLFSKSTIQRHYFIFFYPLPFLLIARGFEIWQQWLGQNSIWFRLLMLVGVAAITLNLITDVNMINFIAQRGGEGEYGTVLADKRAAVEFILNQSVGQYRVDLARTQETLPYEFLFRAVSNPSWDEINRVLLSGSPGESMNHYTIIELPYAGLASTDKIVFQSRGVVVSKP